MLNESVNDLDGNIANWHRAVAADPNTVAFYASQPVNELDLTARHLWLVQHGEQMREDLSAVTRSMDLLLPSNDGKTLYAIGTSDQPDGWIAKLTVGAERAGKQREKPNPLNIAWQGTWSLDKAEDNILSIISRSNKEERACA